eukprot:4828839-Alexandrium_andersonii.AAC.1
MLTPIQPQPCFCEAVLDEHGATVRLLHLNVGPGHETSGQVRGQPRAVLVKQVSGGARTTRTAQTKRFGSVGA